ncbi:death effector domain-containing protein isoform X2 [Melospiza melodia melodia]|uniref:death effector domain-containing protein isoform X2 n=1 Tax=Melospiza melodia melodia TaxID=1914991 RepID=UPI002FD5A9C8
MSCCPTSASRGGALVSAWCDISRYIVIYGVMLVIFGVISGYWGHTICHELLPYVSLKRRHPGECLSGYIAIYGVILGCWGHIITRHELLPYVSLKRRRPVCPDLVDKYLEETSIRYVTPRAPGGAPPGLGHPHKSVPAPHPSLCCPPGGPQLGPKRPGRARSLLGSQRKRRKSATPDPKEKQTCDIRLRVRAEYCQHDSALHGNVFSNKQDPLERQFERFNQANTILKSRDLGSIICDIKFSELTYLDAFWRDYINGSLLEALKGVFITDSLKQAVGHEAIKLLVNVDEEDYELGRQKLLRNLMLHTAP